MVYRKPEPIETNDLCEKGCGNIAKYKTPSGILICDSSINKCPELKRKNSEGVKKAHKNNPNMNKHIRKGIMNGWNNKSENDILEIRKKSRNTLKEKYDSFEYVNHWIGKQHTVETKDKMSKTRIELGSSRRNIYIGKRTIFYYIKVNDLYKIGITCSSIKKRFSKDISNGVNIQMLHEIIFENGEDAFDLEQKLLKENKNIRYKGPKILVSGNSELLISEITLKLD